MKLYKDGQETLVNKNQVKLLLEAGWSYSPITEVFETFEEPASEEEENVKVSTLLKPRKPKKISLKG